MESRLQTLGREKSARSRSFTIRIILTLWWRPRWGAAECDNSSDSALFSGTKSIFWERNTIFFGNYNGLSWLECILSYDVASGSEITLCNKINEPLVVYRFLGNVMTPIVTLRTYHSCWDPSWVKQVQCRGSKVFLEDKNTAPLVRLKSATSRSQVVTDTYEILTIMI